MHTFHVYAYVSCVYPAFIGCFTHTSSSSPMTRDKCPSSRISADRQSQFCFASLLRLFSSKVECNLTQKTYQVLCFRIVLWVCSFVGRAFRYFCVMKNITGVFDSLSTDMHSNQITSSSYHSLHKSQESPTLPVSTATDSSYYNNNQQAGQCAGSPYDQISSYQYQNNSMNSVQYNTKSYELGFGNAFGPYGTYGSCSSPTPADAGKYVSLLLLLTWGNSL